MHAKSIYFLISPIACEFTPIGPSVSAETFYYSVFIISGVALVIRPFLDTISVSLTIDIVTKERAAIRPSFRADTFLDSLFELPFKPEEVHVNGKTFAMLLVVGPLTFVGFTLNLREFALAVGAT